MRNTAATIRRLRVELEAPSDLGDRSGNNSEAILTL